MPAAQASLVLITSLEESYTFFHFFRSLVKPHIPSLRVILMSLGHERGK